MTEKAITPETGLVTVDASPQSTSAAVGGGGLEGADRLSRSTLRWVPPVISPDQQIAASQEMALARAQDMVQNDGYAAAAVASHKDSVVGSQFKLNSKPNVLVLGATDGWAEEFQKVVEARFAMAAESPENWFDARRMNTFTGLIRLAVGGFIMTGEVLASCEWVKSLRSDTRPFSTAIQMLSPYRLSNPDNMMDTKHLKSGVVQDDLGAPQGYWIRNSFPGDQAELNDWKWQYQPVRFDWGRRRMIHIIEQMLPGQSRGISEMVSVLKQMKMTSNFQEITLQNAIVNATYAAAIESELPSDVVFGSMGLNQPTMKEALGMYLDSLTQYVGSGNISIDGVKIPHLFPGTKLNMQPAGTPGGVGTDYEESLLRNIAASLGLSYEQFSKDYTKTNYSSARASMAETWKYMGSRKKLVADRFASMIYTLWLEEEVNAGNVPLPKGWTWRDFYDPMKREALCCAEWIGASRGQIDEKKETEAAILRIKNGLSTYEAEIARLGGDFREVFAQRAREEGIIKKLKLDFSGQMKEGTETGGTGGSDNDNPKEDGDQ
ncbi:portal protein [Xanthomonas phage XAP3]|nr:portal protein [Xanthomonas phage XAP3]